MRHLLSFNMIAMGSKIKLHKIGVPACQPIIVISPDFKDVAVAELQCLRINKGLRSGPGLRTGNVPDLLEYDRAIGALLLANRLLVAVNQETGNR